MTAMHDTTALLTALAVALVFAAIVLASLGGAAGDEDGGAA